jgi:hypothetical protein
VIEQRYPWLADHPHVQHGATIGANNTVYVAAQRLVIGGAPTSAPGAGVFAKWSGSLQLTEPGKSRSRWLLPAWMAPGAGTPPLSLHGDSRRWELFGDKVRLQTVGKGQEFVLHSGNDPTGHAWLRELIETHVM